MDVNEVIYHSCLSGLLTDDMMKIRAKDEENKEWLIEIDMKWGEKSMRPYRIRGFMHMLFLETYDMVVFSLLKELFGFSCPNVIVADYQPMMSGEYWNRTCKGRPYQTPVALVSRIDDRQLNEKDFWPASKENFLLRYRLCILTLLCRFVGVSMSLEDIRICRGVPYVWRVNAIGETKPRTMTKDQLRYFFDLKKGKTTSAILRMAIAYMKNVNFDMDILREYVHLRDSFVRGRVMKGKLKLTKQPKQILGVIEENWLILQTEHPLNIFRMEL